MRLKSDVRPRFVELCSRWKEETSFVSSMTERAMHPAYQQIIGLGHEVLPLIFEQLESDPDHWFWALEAITGESPVPEEHAGDLERMRDDWLLWAKRHPEWLR